MTEQPIISFITICYNGLEDTRELVRSIQKTIRSVSYEIIVIDNASVCNEAEILQHEFPSITTLRSPGNLGFSGGNNLGIRIARGKYIFLINNDTYLKEDGLQYMVERIESHPQVAAVSPKIRFAFAPQQIQFAGYTPLSSITLRNALVGFGQPDDKRFDSPSPTPYLHGAAMMIKREVIEKVGMMPEIYFLYYEELDWCTQMTKVGYQLWYEPRCTVFHKESQSTGQMSELRTYYLTRNRLLYAWRNLTGTKRMLSIIYQIGIAANKNIALQALKGRFGLSAATLKGVFAFFVLPNKMK
ncbi:glycosyltransferase family 2 protein [Bacteroides sp.]